MRKKPNLYLLSFLVLLLSALLLYGFCFCLSTVQAQTLDLPLRMTYDPQTAVITAGQTISLVVRATAAEEILCTTATTLPVRAVLTFDVSISMLEDSNLIQAQAAGLEFVKRLNLDVDQAAIVAFSDRAYTVQPFTNDPVKLTTAIQSLATAGLTDIAAGLRESAEQFAALPASERVVPVIILLSDGQSEPAPALEAAAQIAAQDIRIYSISLGAYADQSLMRQLASPATAHYHAPDATALSDIYRVIQEKIVSTSPAAVEAHFELNGAAFAIADPVGEGDLRWSLRVSDLAQVQTTTLYLVATQPGTHTVFSPLQVHYTCPEQAPIQFSATPTLTLHVRAPIPPCTVSPWGNPCVASLPVLGILIWPCSALGLPWWLCLLILLLLLGLLGLGLWWRWLQSRYQPPASVPAPVFEPALGAPSPDVRALSLKELPFLPSVPSVADSRLSPTLVLGMGQEGQGVLEAITAALSETTSPQPENLWLLPVSFELGSDVACACALSSGQLRAAFDTLGPRPATLDWLPDELWGNLRAAQPLTAETIGARWWGRLAVFVHQERIRSCFLRQLRDLKQTVGEGKLTVYVVAPLADPQVNGALLDLVYLLREQCRQAQVAVAVEGILLVDTLAAVPEEAQKLATAAWRELERVQQLANRWPLRVTYGANGLLSWDVKPFEQCYVLSAQRAMGRPLEGNPLAATLLPTIADFILCRADRKFDRDWAEVMGSVLNVANQLQRQKQAVVYSSLGTLTWVLPVEDFIVLSATQRARALQHQQLQRGFVSSDAAHARALALLASSDSPYGVVLTRLMQTLVDWDREKALPTPDSLEKLALLLGGTSDASVQEFSRRLQDFAEHACAGMQTVYEARAQDYQEALRRFLAKVKNLVKPLPEVEAYRKECLKEQTQAFDTLLSGALLELLNAPAIESVGGLRAACELVEALIPIVEKYKRCLEKLREDRRADWDMLSDRLTILGEQLEALPVTGGYPNFWGAVARGMGVALLAVGGLGMATLAAPPLLLPLGALAAPVVGAGFWETWRRLRAPEIHKKQEEYREWAQKATTAAIEWQLYQIWDDIVAAWLKELSGAEKSLSQWRTEVFDAPFVRESFNHSEQTTQARLAARRQLLTRRYSGMELWRRLDDTVVQPLIARDTACRVQWRQTPGEPFMLHVWGTQEWQFEEPDAPKLVRALQDVGTAYATELRKLRLSDWLVETQTAEAMAQTALEDGMPWIAFEPNAQPEARLRRMLAADTSEASPFFDTLQQTLNASAIHAHTDSQAALSTPYRCAVLSFNEHLLQDGLQLWENLKGPYQHLPRRSRAHVHVLPEERHAFYLESCLAELVQRPANLLSARAVATLRDMRRARAFWLAYAHGWVAKVIQERDSVTSLYSWALVLPDAAPIALTEPQEYLAPLWEAVCAYVLAHAGGPVAQLEAALPALYFPSTGHGAEAVLAELRHALRGARQKAQVLQNSPECLDRELGLVFQAFLEDTIRLLNKQPMLLEVF